MIFSLNSRHAFTKDIQELHLYHCDVKLNVEESSSLYS